MAVHWLSIEGKREIRLKLRIHHSEKSKPHLSYHAKTFSLRKKKNNFLRKHSSFFLATAGSNFFFIWKPFYLLYQEFHFAFEEKTLIQWEVVVIVMWLSLINYGNQFRSLAVYNILCSLFRSLETLERDGWANNTPWYITELISNDTTKELSPESPEIKIKKAQLGRVLKIIMVPLMLYPFVNDMYCA